LSVRTKGGMRMRIFSDCKKCGMKDSVTTIKESGKIIFRCYNCGEITKER